MGQSLRRDWRKHFELQRWTRHPIGVGIRDVRVKKRRCEQAIKKPSASADALGLRVATAACNVAVVIETGS